MLLVRWYDYTKWLLKRVDSFPKNQQFIFGTRLANPTLDIMELLIEASDTRHKASLLHTQCQREAGAAALAHTPPKDHKVITPSCACWSRSLIPVL